jgi:hypothetical protein
MIIGKFAANTFMPARQENQLNERPKCGQPS